MTDSNVRGEVERQVIERAGRDPDFRRRLLNNPRGTVKQEYGVSIPDAMEVTVVEARPDSYYLVLPPSPKGPDAELSDQDLEAVAGGWTGFTEGDFCYTKACRGTGVPC